MSVAKSTVVNGWRKRLPESVRPYVEAGPLAAFFLGVSSAFPYALIELL